jgi:hypothetical protein
MNNGRFMPQSKRAEKEVAELLGIPSTLASETNAQLESINRKFMSWLRDGVVPIVDEDMDDSSLFQQELGLLLLGDDAVEKAEQVRWDQTRDELYGWKEDLAKLQDAVLSAKQVGWKPGTPILQALNIVAQQQAQMAFQESQQMFTQTQDQWVNVAKNAVAMGQPLPPEPQPPQPVPPQPVEFVNPAPLKPALQHMILWLWEDLLMRKGIEVSPELKSYMGIRSTWEHYRLLTVSQQGAMPAEPGADEAPTQQEQAPPMAA